MGCDFVQVAPPHYMVSSNDEVFEHFKAINDNVDIGIMAYNTLWAMPAPGYDFNENGLTRFLDLENVEGVKWSTHDQSHFMTISRLFADKFSFIDNQATNHLSLSIKLGFADFINSDGLVAPRLVLHLWDLWKQNRRRSTSTCCSGSMSTRPSAWCSPRTSPGRAWAKVPTLGSEWRRSRCTWVRHSPRRCPFRTTPSGDGQSPLPRAAYNGVG